MEDYQIVSYKDLKQVLKTIERESDEHVDIEYDRLHTLYYKKSPAEKLVIDRKFRSVVYSFFFESVQKQMMAIKYYSVNGRKENPGLFLNILKDFLRETSYKHFPLRLEDFHPIDFYIEYLKKSIDVQKPQQPKQPVKKTGIFSLFGSSKKYDDEYEKAMVDYKQKLAEYEIALVNYKKKLAEYESRIAKYNCNLSRNGKDELYNELYIRKLNDECEKYFQNYTKNFDNYIAQESVKYIAYKPVVQAAGMMMERIFNAIESAARGEFIPTVNVNFYITTTGSYTDLGGYKSTFLFNNFGYPDLKGDVDIFAFSKALVSAIEMNIRLKYPQDISGTEYSIEAKNVYNGERHSEDFPASHVKITYTAPNGFYKEL